MAILKRIEFKQSLFNEKWTEFAAQTIKKKLLVEIAKGTRLFSVCIIICCVNNDEEDESSQVIEQRTGRVCQPDLASND